MIGAPNRDDRGALGDFDKSTGFCVAGGGRGSDDAFGMGPALSSGSVAMMTDATTSNRVGAVASLTEAYGCVSLKRLKPQEGFVDNSLLKERLESVERYLRLSIFLHDSKKASADITSYIVRTVDFLSLCTNKFIEKDDRVPGFYCYKDKENKGLVCLYGEKKSNLVVLRFEKTQDYRVCNLFDERSKGKGPAILGFGVDFSERLKFLILMYQDAFYKIQPGNQRDLIQKERVYISDPDVQNAFLSKVFICEQEKKAICSDSSVNQEEMADRMVNLARSLLVKNDKKFLLVPVFVMAQFVYLGSLKGYMEFLKLLVKQCELGLLKQMIDMTKFMGPVIKNLSFVKNLETLLTSSDRSLFEWPVVPVDELMVESFVDQYNRWVKLSEQADGSKSNKSSAINSNILCSESILLTLMCYLFDPDKNLFSIFVKDFEVSVGEEFIKKIISFLKLFGKKLASMHNSVPKQSVLGSVYEALRRQSDECLYLLKVKTNLLAMIGNIKQVVNGKNNKTGRQIWDQFEKFVSEEKMSCDQVVKLVIVKLTRTEVQFLIDVGATKVLEDVGGGEIGIMILAGLRSRLEQMDDWRQKTLQRQKEKDRIKSTVDEQMKKFSQKILEVAQTVRMHEMNFIDAAKNIEKNFGEVRGVLHDVLGLNETVLTGNLANDTLAVDLVKRALESLKEKLRGNYDCFQIIEKINEEALKKLMQLHYKDVFHNSYEYNKREEPRDNPVAQIEPLSCVGTGHLAGNALTVEKYNVEEEVRNLKSLCQAGPELRKFNFLEKIHKIIQSANEQCGLNTQDVSTHLKALLADTGADRTAYLIYRYGGDEVLSYSQAFGVLNNIFKTLFDDRGVDYYYDNIFNQAGVDEWGNEKLGSVSSGVDLDPVSSIVEAGDAVKDEFQALPLGVKNYFNRLFNALLNDEKHVDSSHFHTFKERQGNGLLEARLNQGHSSLRVIIHIYHYGKCKDIILLHVFEEKEGKKACFNSAIGIAQRRLHEYLSARREEDEEILNEFSSQPSTSSSLAVT